MGKSKIKQNPIAQMYLRQIEAIEEARQYWLKNPKEFMKWFTFNILCKRDFVLYRKVMEKK